MVRKTLLSQRLCLPGRYNLHSLPDWAKFMLDAGQEYSRRVTSDTRHILAMDLPDTRFAAALFSAGVVAERSQLDEVKDSAHHFQNLMKLKPGSRVVAPNEKGNLQTYEILAPASKADRVERVRLREISRAKYPITRNIPVSGCSGITISEPNAKIKAHFSDIPFLSGIMGRKRAVGHALNTTLEILILGEIATLRSEIAETKFCTYENNDETGTLQSIIRGSRFPLSVTPFFRSAIDTPRKTRQVRVIDPQTVIFRDSMSFAKCWSRFPRSNWVVFMGNSEPRYREAASILNERLSTNGESEELISNNQANIGILSFKEPIYERVANNG